ncbi:MAG TPA: DUF1326 domain-containing protein [Mycobacteriales bacterium]|nr:DUF1326 domain-containing protein [Mycobacteriales bacterium]
MTTATMTGYRLKGTLLEACSCGVLCPCWIGEDPDLGECWAANAYHFDSGDIGGVDVSGLNLVNIVHIPGNVLTPNSWRLVMYVDASADEAQKDAIVRLYKGELGGPIADLAGLIGEVVAVESAEIVHQLSEGNGTLRIDGVLDAEMAPYRGADGTVTTLRDSLFSTVPGSPAWVGKASKLIVTLPQYGMEWSYEGTNAIQADYQIEFAG